MWDKSKQHCETNKGELVSMETEQEWAFINTQIQTITTDGISRNEWYIGLHENNGNWRWLSNQPLAYDKWQTGQPDNISNDAPRRYGIMAKAANGLFANVMYGLYSGQICEYKGQGNKTISLRCFDFSSVQMNS